MIDYSATVYPDRWRICGMRIHPMTLGHALLLRRFDHPAAKAELSVGTVGDAALLVYVCSRSWKKAAAAVNSWICKPSLWWIGLRILCGHKRCASNIIAYLRAMWKGPEVMIEKTGSSDNDVLRILVSTLTAKMGYAHSEAMNMSVQRALWEVCGFWAQEGSLRFATPEQAAIFESLRESKWNNG